MTLSMFCGIDLVCLNLQFVCSCVQTIYHARSKILIDVPELQVFLVQRK